MYLNWFTIECKSLFEVSGVYYVEKLDRKIINSAIEKFRNIDQHILPHFIHVGTNLTEGKI